MSNELLGSHVKQLLSGVSDHGISHLQEIEGDLVKYALETDEKNLGFVDFQGHDFSFRGMQHPDLGHRTVGLHAEA